MIPFAFLLGVILGGVLVWIIALDRAARLNNERKTTGKCYYCGNVEFVKRPPVICPRCRGAGGGLFQDIDGAVRFDECAQCEGWGELPQAPLP